MNVVSNILTNYRHNIRNVEVVLRTYIREIRL